MRCGLQLLLIVNLLAWALLAPITFLRSCPPCEGGPPDDRRQSTDLPPWAQSVLQSVESQLREGLRNSSLGLSEATGERLVAELPAILAREARVSSEECRAAAELEPVVNLTLPVLDSLGGKVRAAEEAGANRWGVPMANLTVEVSPGRVLTLDEVLYGYDLAFEALHLFSYTSWGRVAMQQDPADAMAIADLLSRLQPDCFVELGTNTGGGAIWYAEVMKGYHPNPLVVTLDVKVPDVNWDRFAKRACPHCVSPRCHPLWQEGLITFVQGFSQDPKVLEQVEGHLSRRGCKRTAVMHDSDHRRASVVQDLKVYQKFVSPRSYLIVQDTKLSRMRGGHYSTLEAVEDFLSSEEGRGRFVVDKGFEYLLFSHHHNGFLQRVA